MGYSDKIGYSQHDEEKLELDYFQEFRGKLLDIGACDGTMSSNTRKLMELGWEGVFIEPGPVAFNRLKELYKENNRAKCMNVALGSTSGELTFYDSNGDGISTFDPEFKKKWETSSNAKYTECKVAMMSVNLFFENFGYDYDLISLDTEGMNLEIFRLIPFEKLTNLKMFIVEHDNNIFEMKNRMINLGFTLISQSAENLVFIKSNKIKVFITKDAFIDRQIFAKECDVCLTYNDADYIISGSFPNEEIPALAVPGNPYIKKLVYMTSEPAICLPRTYFYSQFKNMPLAVTYNPQADNEIPLTIDNKYGAAFPYPIVSIPEPILRADTTIKNRGIFHAGALGLESDERPHGFINIRKLRRTFTEYLERKPNCYVVGNGTKRGMTDGRHGDVRGDKQRMITESNCDFVLAMENSVYPDYVTEKIGEGFTSDRVTLYLGAPNIENHVPLNCFVDLRKWFNPEDKSFDFTGMEKYLLEMTQEEYDAILRNAREFRKNSKELYKLNQEHLTRTVINRLKAIYKPL